MTFKTAVLAIAVLIPTFSYAADAMHGTAMEKSRSPADQAYSDAMRKMMDDTMAMKPTGDADMDFVMMMKPHHRAAVEMAQAYLKYGSDPVLTKMANDIVASQTAEIEQMDDWAKQHGM